MKQTNTKAAAQTKLTVWNKDRTRLVAKKIGDMDETHRSNLMRLLKQYARERRDGWDSKWYNTGLTLRDVYQRLQSFETANRVKTVRVRPHVRTIKTAR